MNLITAFANHWAAQFWPVSMQAAVFIALAYAISICFRRLPARYRYFLWLLVLLRLAIPASITSPWGIGQYPERFLAKSIRWISGQAAGTLDVQSDSTTAIEARFWPGTDDSALILCLLWLSGIMVFSALVIARMMRLRRRISMLLPIDRPDLISMVHRMTARLALKRKIRLLQADDAGDVPFPTVHGIIRSTIILPGNMASNWTEHALEPVLLHELTHIKRRDCLVSLVQLILQILYFYHPMVWLANWTVRRERELACDDDVVRRCGGRPTEYVRSMIQAAEAVVHRKQWQLFGIGMAESFSNLGRRIRRMMHTNYGANERFGFIYFGAVLVLGLFCAVVSCKGPEQAQVYTVGKDVKPPVILTQPLPSYTDEARKARAEGIVLLQGVVRKNGSVDNLKILKGLGHGLDESAINTISTKWRFKPGTLNGMPVDVQANIEVSFRLY